MTLANLFQVPIRQIESDIVDLKPKVLVIGQGLWYGISHPPAKFGTKFENYYRNDLRIQLDKLVGILKKVEKHSLGMQ